MRRAGPRPRRGSDPIHPVTVRGPAAERLRISVCRTSSACHVCPNVIRSSAACATGTGSAAPTTIARDSRPADRDRRDAARAGGRPAHRSPRAPTSVHAPRRRDCLRRSLPVVIAPSCVELIRTVIVSQTSEQDQQCTVRQDCWRCAAASSAWPGRNRASPDGSPPTNSQPLHNPCSATRVVTSRAVV